MQLSLIIPLIIYLVLLFGASWYAYSHRRGDNFLSEYLLGNRSMSGFVLAMTTTSSYVGASSLIGGAGASYKYGLGWVLLAMIQAPVILLTLGILGKKIAIVARANNSLTINDILYHRYHSTTITLLASCALLVSFFIMMAVQFIGLGRLLETSLNMNYHTAVVIMAIVVGAYTFIGGFRAVVLTDTIQGVIMLAGTFLLLGATIYAGGGIANIMQDLAHIDPQLLTPYGTVERSLDFNFMSSFWVLVCFGLIGLPSTMVRAIAYKDSQALHRGIIIGSIVISLLMLGIHLTGALGRALLPNLAVADSIIPALMLKVLPPTLAGVFIASPMAGIMSSIDSMLIQSSATLIKDLYLRFAPHNATNHRRLKFLSTLSTLIIIALVALAVLNPPPMLIWLNIFALGGLESTFLWIVLFALYVPSANAQGAICSMLVGLISYIALTTLKINIFGFNPIIPALTLGLSAFIIGNKIGTKK